MKRFILVVLILLFGCSSNLTTTVEKVAESEIEHLGVVAQGTSKKEVLLLDNQQDVSMHVDMVRSSCKCVRAEFFPSELAPGERGFISLEVEPESDFLGDRYFELTGVSPEGELLFVRRAVLHVVRKSDLGF